MCVMAILLFADPLSHKNKCMKIFTHACSTNMCMNIFLHSTLFIVNTFMYIWSSKYKCI